MQNLVIVESPTKAKTLQKFLGNKYHIEASMGHIRDLPKSDLGVDIEHNFEPQYIIPRDKRKRVNQLVKLSKEAETLWLATDPDREGEAIAWHLEQILGKPKAKQAIKRVVFHEITEEAIKEAFGQPRDINLQLVDAQQARRVLDRLVGYKLSPLLWHKVKRGLSAGRVQSVALRLIVEKEREIEKFKPEEYWIIEAELETKDKKQETKFLANLVELNNKKLKIKNKDEADTHLKTLEKADYQVSKVIKKEVKRYTYPPFTTSTLQQTASNRLGYSSKKTMMLAQALYEHGFITYMRTDSFNLSTSAVTAVRKYIEQGLGKNYLPEKPKFYKSKSKNAQEAHEAIRPTNPDLTPDKLKLVEGLNRDHFRLYDLIWRRFIACQMADALLDQTTIEIEAAGPALYLLRASGSVVKFDGWFRLYEYGTEEKEEEKNQTLPELTEGENLDLLQLLSAQHFTQPPARFTEASLIKKLEELGIGRPSTYAPILSTIQERLYVEKQERKFTPTQLGLTTSDFLMKYFPDVFDYSFTASMEDELDEISRGERDWKPTIEQFFNPFAKKLATTEEGAQRVKMEMEYVDKTCPNCSKQLVVRFGKFGKFVACSGFPACKYTERLEQKVDVKCPIDGGDIVIRRTKRGKTFYGCKNWPGCKFASWTKPKGLDKDPVKE